MADLYVLMNHRLTESQETAARETLGVQHIVDLPPDLQRIWRQIPADAPEIMPVLEPVLSWIGRSAKASDYILVQGDFGACFLAVRFALDSRLLPVYSTTRREASEEHGEDGFVEMRHRFRHVIFRRYGR